MRPTFEKTCQMFPSRSQFSPIFKRIDVLPRRLQILAPQTIMSLFNHLAVMLCKIYWNKSFIVKDFFSPLVFGVRWQDFPSPTHPFYFKGYEFWAPLLLAAILRTCMTSTRDSFIKVSELYVTQASTKR